jgi:hypothetical protein
MKIGYVKIVSLFGLLLLTSASFAQNNGGTIVRWKRIVGVITAPDDATTEANEGLNSPVGNISSGTFPWSARDGRARVNLATGAASFDVEGLVIVGNPVSGTPGPITAVTGCLVCNAATPAQAVLDTPPVALSDQGDASFSGQIDNIPATCNNPLFLIRIAVPQGAAGLWIATGAERTISNKGQ